VRVLLGALSTPVERRLLLVLAAVVVVAWLPVVVRVDGEGAGMPGFVAAWTVMMVAMMLPSAAPFVLLYRRGSTASGTAALAAGYLAVWAAAGLAAWALHQAAMDIPVPLVLAAAGVYQLTPAKEMCLRRCRTPADFLVERWRTNAFLLGADHGRWCLGCCWALMVVLVVAGMMGVLWVVSIAAIVAVEKLMRRGVGLARLTGVALIALAVWEVVR
jgi:predicted metal-binding membrane protein